MMEQIETKPLDESPAIASASPVDPRVERPKSKGQPRWKSLWISGAVHVLLIGVLAFWYLPKLDSQPVVADSANRANVATKPTELPSSTDSTAALPPANVPAEKIKASLNANIQATADRSDERNLQALDQNLNRAQQVVKPESVNELVEAVAGSMNIDTNVYADKKPVAGTTFDPNTAQLTSVERKATGDGNWTYEALMVDRNGNRSTVPMTPAEGATAYEAFEKIKSMPMAGAIYQQLVMPILQQLVEPENPRPAGNTVVTPAVTPPPPGRAGEN
jgi:hypothetical protein